MNIDTLLAKQAPPAPSPSLSPAQLDDVENIKLAPPPVQHVTLPQQPLLQRGQQPPFQQPLDGEYENPVITRRKLINKITGIRNKFAHKLTSINMMNIDGMDIDQLDDLLEEICFAIGVQHGCQFTKAIASFGVILAESVVTPHLTGLGEALNKIQDCNDTLDEITLVYGDYIYQNPLVRLAGIVAATAFNVYTLNNAKTAVRTILKSPVIPEVVTHYQNL